MREILLKALQSHVQGNHADLAFIRNLCNIKATLTMDDHIYSIKQFRITATYWGDTFTFLITINKATDMLTLQEI